MIKRIIVWERSTGLQRPVGEIAWELISENGKARGAFRYLQDYLDRDDAYPLDPVSLPLSKAPFEIDHPGIFGVFEDSLPDDWGRKLLVRKHNIKSHQQTLPTLLLALGASGLGALSYSEKDSPKCDDNDASYRSLNELIVAAEMYEKGKVSDTELSMLLGASSSPGGARPKALIYDDDNDIHYIAKFPSIKDYVDVVRVEAATMKLARKAGLRPPDTIVAPCGKSQALLVRRFDILPDSRRKHMISLQTLLKAEGWYQKRYIDILGIIRKYSSNPEEDSSLFFRQMVFNAVIGNTDDHLKNFWMIYDFKDSWRLSPAFDLVPNIRQVDEHVLFFDLGPVYPGRVKLEKIGLSWGIGQVKNIIEEVFIAVGQWRKIFSEFGIFQNDIDRFNEIDDKLAR